MSRKSDRAKLVRTDIARAFEHRQAVRITRTVRSVEPVEGFVAAVGLRWLVIHRISTDLDLDGYTALRWKHVKRTTPLGTDHVAVRALAHRRVTPVPSPEVDSTTTGLLLRSVAASFDVVTIRTETTGKAGAWIGPISGFSAKTVTIAPIDADGHCAADGVEVPFELITRVDLGTRYQMGLASAAEVAAQSTHLSAVR